MDLEDVVWIKCISFVRFINRICIFNTRVTTIYPCWSFMPLKEFTACLIIDLIKEFLLENMKVLKIFMVESSCFLNSKIYNFLYSNRPNLDHKGRRWLSLQKNCDLSFETCGFGLPILMYFFVQILQFSSPCFLSCRRQGIDIDRK